MAASSVLEPTLGFLVHDVARLMRRRFEQCAREARLPLNRSLCSVLVHVARAEGMSQARLAEKLDVEPITLVRMVDRLETAGLIERRLNPKDRRVWLLYLTEASQPIVRQIRRLGQTVREEAMSGLPEPDRAVLMAALQHLKTNLCSKPAIGGRPPGRPLAHAALEELVGKDA